MSASPFMRLHRLFSSAGLGLVMALSGTVAGCPQPGPSITGSPTPAPAATVTPTPAPVTPTPTPTPSSNTQVFVSGSAIVNGTLTVRVRRATDNGALDGATVTISGPTPGWGTTSAGNSLTFNPLEGGTYSIRVSASGYVTQTIGPFALDPKVGSTQTVTMQAQSGRVVGRVLDVAGTPITGARITSGDNAALSGTDGRFTLTGLPGGVSTVAIARSSYVTATMSVSMAGSDVSVADVRLFSNAQQPVVSFENAGQSFNGGTVATSLAPLRNAIASAGFALNDGASVADVRVVASPTSATVTDSLVERLRQFVWNGGKLILIGEWGGSFDYNPEAINRLARPYGLAFNPDLVRSPNNPTNPGWLSIPTVGAVLPTPNAIANGIQLFEACSLFVPPPAVGFAFAGSNAYRIAATFDSGPCLAAVRVYGQGMVLCLGDTSAWTAGNITGNGLLTSNLGAADNQKFMLDLFSW